jgi:hypothetical protein
MIQILIRMQIAYLLRTATIGRQVNGNSYDST